MSHVRRFLFRLAALFRVTRAEAELSREVDAHLQLLEDEFVAKGMARGEARYAAKRAFGGVEQAKELHRDARAFRWLAGWPMDMKLGARMLVRSPGLTVIAVIALAVAFGAGATYLEFVNGMVRPTLSFPGGERLVGIATRDIERNQTEPRILADFAVWRGQLRLIEHLGASRDITGDLKTPDGREGPVDGARISASAFRVVPVTPILGRPLVDADEDGASAPVAVIGEALWRSRFDGAADIIGRTATIEDEVHTIVGVMPSTFGFPRNHNLWIPLRTTGVPIARGDGPPVGVFGRLAAGASLDAAQAELEAVRLDAPAAAPGSSPRTLRPVVRPYVASLISALDFNNQILALYALNLLFVALLAICAANVATLVFGRTVTREAEITVRTALGASRGRIVSQLVAEAVVLTSIAAAAGLAATKAGLRWVRVAWEQGQGSAMPFWWDDALDLETFLYMAVLVLFAALIVGGIPGLKATGPEMQTRLKYAGAGSTMKFGKMWTGIIVTQVAVTVVFLLSVVAMAWSIMTITQTFDDVAFNRADYLAATMTPAPEADREPADVTYRRRQEVLRRILASPAVAGATYTTRLPGADQEDTYFELDGQRSPVRVAHVGPDFFETFARPLIAGRQFTQSELAGGANVAVVDESFVRFVMGGRAAVGQQVRKVDPSGAEEPGPLLEIIGVTADMSTAERKSLKDAHLYRPIGAVPTGDSVLIVHAQAGYRDRGLSQVTEDVRELASAAPAGTRVSGLWTLDASGGGDVIEYVFAALGIIGAVALLLSTAGIYALVSFTLARRTREIGIRTALGASPRRIVTGILSRALWQVGLGVALGLLPGVLIVGSVAAEAGRNGLADGLAVGGAVAAFVLIVAAMSCSVPLRRALRVQPTDALRIT
jgi:putative ABC transport system permease protein